MARLGAQKRWMFSLITVLPAVTCLIYNGCGDSRSPTGNQKPAPAPDYPRPAYSEPVWSSDGLRIGFNYRPLDSIYVDAQGHHHYVFVDSLNGFWMVDSGGQNMRRVFARNLGDPTWSPDGNWIAYYQSGDIWKVRTTPTGVDTTTAERLTFRGTFFSPVWNPPSTWLLFFQPDGAGAGLYRLGIGGGLPEPIAGSYRWQVPTWSRDSTRLAFIMDYHDTSAQSIGSSNASGGDLQLVRSALHAPWYPKWSPDGTKLTFVGRDPADELQYLWIMNADGTGQRKVTLDTVGSGYSWSPDGTQIAYVRLNLFDHSLQNGTVWIVDVNTGARRQLTVNSP